MNKKDRDNLVVILTKASEGENTLDEFLNTLDDDDLCYARDLLIIANEQRQNVVDKLFS